MPTRSFRRSFLGIAQASIITTLVAARAETEDVAAGPHHDGGVATDVGASDGSTALRRESLCPCHHHRAAGDHDDPRHPWACFEPTIASRTHCCPTTGLRPGLVRGVAAGRACTAVGYVPRGKAATHGFVSRSPWLQGWLLVLCSVRDRAGG